MCVEGESCGVASCELALKKVWIPKIRGTECEVNETEKNNSHKNDEIKRKIKIIDTCKTTILKKYQIIKIKRPFLTQTRTNK